MSLELLNLTGALMAESARQKSTRKEKVLHAQRAYGAAQLSRLTADWRITNTSEDAELSQSLRTVRGRSRQLIRDNSYAQRAKTIVQNNVIGTGIGMVPRVMNSRGEASERVNDQIAEAWENWCRASLCHVGASLHFADLERLLVGEVFEAGEVFTRKYFSALPESDIPLALEVIEPERVADEFQPSPPDAANTVRMGIELNRFLRPMAYWFRLLHPGETSLMALAPDRIERVPADQIMHLRMIQRWPQTRAIPWLHAAARRLHDMDGYTEAEIVAARGAAAYMGVIESPNPQGEQTDAGKREWTIEPGLLEHLAPGEKMIWNNPNRPNANLDPFLRLLLREIASGVGVSYESLSRDYSKSNYSSSRLGLLDDRDLWRVLQMWFIRGFRHPLHRVWLQQAVLAGQVPAISLEEYAMNPAKFEAVQFKPRGWGWVDPAKEVEAYKEAIRAGLTSQQHVVAMTGDGRDFWEVTKEREADLATEKESGVSSDVDPGLEKQQAAAAAPGPKPNGAAPPEDDEEAEMVVN